MPTPLDELNFKRDIMFSPIFYGIFLALLIVICIVIFHCNKNLRKKKTKWLTALGYIFATIFIYLFFVISEYFVVKIEKILENNFNFNPMNTPISLGHYLLYYFFVLYITFIMFFCLHIFKCKRSDADMMKYILKYSWINSRTTALIALILLILVRNLPKAKDIVFFGKIGRKWENVYSDNVWDVPDAMGDIGYNAQDRGYITNGAYVGFITTILVIVFFASKQKC